MKLNELHDNPGARKARMRVGRGIGSGKGKTGGRGVKGQTSRSGVSINGFEGGQMPLHRRIPKRGFTNHMRMDYVVVNLGEIQKAIDAKKLDAAAVIDAAALIASGVLRRARDGVRVLAKGDFSAKNLRFSVIGASAPALAAIEAAGGTVEILLKSKAEPEAAA
jgi:large subunit ribosomal protein L15